MDGYKPTLQLKEGNYLNYTVGGWYELFPNAGNACMHRGAPYGTHGEAHMLKWDYYISKNTVEEIEIIFDVKTVYSPFVLEKKVSIKRNSLVFNLEEKVTNTGLNDAQFVWGHHITLGQAFLNENCRISLPECEIFKRPEYDSTGSRLTPEAKGKFQDMPGKNGERVDLSIMPAWGSGISEMVFVQGLKEHWYSVVDMEKRVGIALCWDKDAYPGLWFWQECNDYMDFPWYGKTYAMAIEPASTNTPMLESAVNDGTCCVLKPNESKSSWITAIAHREIGEICGVSKAGLVVSR